MGYQARRRRPGRIRRWLCYRRALTALVLRYRAARGWSWADVALIYPYLCCQARRQADLRQVG